MKRTHIILFILLFSSITTFFTACGEKEEFYESKIANENETKLNLSAPEDENDRELISYYDLVDGLIIMGWNEIEPDPEFEPLFPVEFHMWERDGDTKTYYLFDSYDQFLDVQDGGELKCDKKAKAYVVEDEEGNEGVAEDCIDPGNECGVAFNEDLLKSTTVCCGGY